MTLRQTSLAACLMILSLAAAAEPAADRLFFFDETAQRHLSLEKAGFGNTTVTVRFALDPGSSGIWTGGGMRKDKELTFARNVNEGEDRGTYFVAEISESKVVIGFKEGQKEPQDAGINGTYKRASETRLLQLLKKEFQAANERLTTALKNASKSWASSDRAALGLWKDQWPVMRQRWVDANLKTAAAKSADPRAPQTKPAEPTAEQWLKTAQATARDMGSSRSCLTPGRVSAGMASMMTLAAVMPACGSARMANCVSAWCPDVRKGRRPRPSTPPCRRNRFERTRAGR